MLIFVNLFLGLWGLCKVCQDHVSSEGPEEDYAAPLRNDYENSHMFIAEVVKHMSKMYEHNVLGSVSEMAYENSRRLAVYNYNLTLHYMFKLYNFICLGQIWEMSYESSHQGTLNLINSHCPTLYYMFIMSDSIYLGQVREVSYENSHPSILKLAKCMFKMYDVIFSGAACEMAYENPQWLAVFKHCPTTRYIFIMYNLIHLGQLCEVYG